MPKADASSALSDYIERMERKRGYGELTLEIDRLIGEGIKLRKQNRDDPRIRELALRVDQLAQERGVSPV